MKCNCHRWERGVCPVHGLQDPTADRLNRELQAEADAQLGARVRELLASEEPPEGMWNATSASQAEVRKVWAWCREQLLGGGCCCGNRDCGGACCAECHPGAPSRTFAELTRCSECGEPGTLKTGGALGERLGPLEIYDGLGFWTESEDGRAFHHASEEILQQAAAAWNREHGHGR